MALQVEKVMAYLVKAFPRSVARPRCNLWLVLCRVILVPYSEIGVE